MSFSGGCLGDFKGLGQAAKRPRSGPKLIQKAFRTRFDSSLSQENHQKYKNQGMTSFFKRILKCRREPDFLSWPSGQKHPRMLLFGPRFGRVCSQENHQKCQKSGNDIFLKNNQIFCFVQVVKNTHESFSLGQKMS